MVVLTETFNPSFCYLQKQKNPAPATFGLSRVLKLYSGVSVRLRSFPEPNEQVRSGRQCIFITFIGDGALGLYGLCARHRRGLLPVMPLAVNGDERTADA